MGCTPSSPQALRAQQRLARPSTIQIVRLRVVVAVFGRPPRLMGRHSALCSGPIGVISPDRPKGGTSLASSPLRRSIYCFMVPFFSAGRVEKAPSLFLSIPAPAAAAQSPRWLLRCIPSSFGRNFYGREHRISVFWLVPTSVPAIVLL